MKVLFLVLFLMSSIFADSLNKYHEVFLKLDVHSKSLDLEKAIKDIKKARAEYPLDDKLKMVDMELENRYANELKKKKFK